VLFRCQSHGTVRPEIGKLLLLDGGLLSCLDIDMERRVAVRE
jgi:hypothetical protein